MIETLFKIWTVIEPYSACYGALVAFCTAFVKITPSQKDDAILTKILKVADFFSTAFLKSDLLKIQKGEEKIEEEKNR